LSIGVADKNFEKKGKEEGKETRSHNSVRLKTGQEKEEQKRSKREKASVESPVETLMIANAKRREEEVRKKAAQGANAPTIPARKWWEEKKGKEEGGGEHQDTLEYAHA